MDARTKRYRHHDGALDQALDAAASTRRLRLVTRPQVGSGRRHALTARRSTRLHRGEASGLTPKLRPDPKGCRFASAQRRGCRLGDGVVRTGAGRCFRIGVGFVDLQHPLDGRPRVEGIQIDVIA